MNKKEGNEKETLNLVFVFSLFHYIKNQILIFSFYYFL